MGPGLRVHVLRRSVGGRGPRAPGGGGRRPSGGHGSPAAQRRRHHRGGHARARGRADRRPWPTAGIPPADVAVHFHDTYGQALANTLAALEAGVTTIDASAGGLGGCPYAESATGNLATEDLVWQLDGLGIDTGVDLEALVATSVWLAGELGRPSPSRVVQALGGTDA